MFTKDEKKILKCLVQYHIKETKQDRRGFRKSLIAEIGLESKYEMLLKKLMKKLK